MENINECRKLTDNVYTGENPMKNRRLCTLCVSINTRTSKLLSIHEIL